MKYTEIKVTLENEDSAIFSQPLPKGSQILMFPRDGNYDKKPDFDEYWSDVDLHGNEIAGRVVAERNDYYGITYRIPKNEKNIKS